MATNKRKMREWHRAVCIDNECSVCQRFGDEQTLCGHHIKSQGSHPELRYEVSNGLCVCLECHNKIHNGNITL